MESRSVMNHSWTVLRRNLKQKTSHSKKVQYRQEKDDIMTHYCQMGTRLTINSG